MLLDADVELLLVVEDDELGEELELFDGLELPPLDDIELLSADEEGLLCDVAGLVDVEPPLLGDSVVLVVPFEGSGVS